MLFSQMSTEPNNPRTPEIAEHLGIARFFTRIFTPKLCEGCKPKPHIGLWDYVVRHVSSIDINNSVMIGDDPWSDGEFAQKVGLPCWILDRNDRFSSMRGSVPYNWIKSLTAIPLREL
jgi:FMN phosphatase YigB (HAD superfamily)